ncbi:MAG: hemerythrin domain-containing protein [Deltaproteobacteria bacterium]|nr:hemerythrin domain-containing protein [Deltaproteobacteria bacterium]
MSIAKRLRQEHREILSYLQNAIRLARSLEKGNPLRVDQVLPAVNSFRAFNDQVHFPKEEQLFQTLALQDLEEIELQLLVELEAEHKASQELLNNVFRQVLQQVPQIQMLKTRVVENLWTFVELNRRHMAKEEKRLLPLVEKRLSASDQNRFLKYFDLPEESCELLAPLGADVI